MNFDNAYEQSGGPLITDDVIIVMELAEPNSCVTYQGCTVQVNGFDITITVNFQYDPPPPACFFFYNQFTDLLNIGKLPAGVYTATVTGANVTNTPFQFSFEVFGTGNCIEPDVINLGKACPGGTQVCGCNGVTYANACTAFYKNGVTSWTNGACVNSCVSNPVSVNITPGAPMPICFGNTVNLTAAGSGSTSPYTYAWSNSAVGGTINVPATTATYTVTVTSSAGCTATASQVVTVLEPISISNLNANSLSGTFIVSGGLPELNGSNYTSLTMTLQGNPGVTGTLMTAPFTHGETVNFSVPQAGTYVITGTDAANCSESVQISISNGAGNGGPQDTCGFFDPNPIYPTDESLNDLDFINANRGLCVGFSGKIMRSEDGGQSWINSFSGTNNNLDAVDFVTPNIAWTVGHFPNGVVLKSSNGGISWSPVDVGGNEQYIDVFFLDQNTGWILQFRNSILKTIDGGNSWTEYTVTNSTTLSLDEVYFVNANVGFIAAESGRVFKTTNGGLNWTMSVASNQVGGLNSIYFTDVNNGWACGTNDGEIVHTSNGGNNWTTQLLSAGESFNCVRFFDNLTGIATSSRDIYRTTNGGNTWTRVATGIVNTIGLNEIAIFNGTAWVSGGTLLKSTDNGTTWNTLSRGINDNISHITFTPGGIGWATGTSCLWKSQDNGASWQPNFLSPTNFTSNTFFINDNIGWVYTFFSLYKTIDGGNTWNEIAAPGTSIYNLNFINPNVGWAIGLSGQIYKTVDGGNSWVPQSAPVTSDLLDSYFENDQNGIIVGRNTILKTTNGGQTWASVYNGSQWLDDISMIDANQGYAFSTSQVAKTIDGGNTWNFLSVSSTLISGGQFASLDTGYLVGRTFTGAPLIMRTTDGGANWSALPHSDTINPLHTIFITDATDIFVGGKGGILKLNGLACSQMTTPTPNSTASPNTSIIWDTVACATGYLLSIGTTAGGTDLLDKADLGLVNSYTPVQPLPENDTIYVTISPYNDLGILPSCTSYLFETSAIDTLTLTISSATIPANTVFPIDLSTQQFTNTSGLQFTFQWDPMLIEYQFIEWVNPLQNQVLDTVTQINTGKFTLSWSSLTPLTLPNDAILFRVYFKAIGNPGSTGFVVLGNSPTPLEAFDNQFNLVPVNTTPGTVTILPNSCTTVTTTADAGPGSLREAINCANTNPGPDTIRFNIPGAGPHVIAPLSSLPVITDDSTVINATTQPNFAEGSIDIFGVNSPAGIGLQVEANYFELYGIFIHEFVNNELIIVGDNCIIGDSILGNIFSGNNNAEVHILGNNNLIKNNKIGTDLTGRFDYSSIGNIGLVISGVSNVIEDNVIAGFGSSTVAYATCIHVDSGSNNTIIRSNKIGTDIFGTTLISGPNMGSISVVNSDNVIIENNILAGLWEKLQLVATRNSIVRNNFIGISSDGVTPLGANTAYGITCGSQVGIGGCNSIVIGPDNLIGFATEGIRVTNNSTQVRITQNSFICNSIQGINLLPNGNNNFPSPNIISATDQEIIGKSSPNSTIEVFIHENLTCPSTPCQGKTFIGTVSSDFSGNWTLSAPFGTTLAIGDFIIATATDNLGNTSQFSNCVEVLNSTCITSPFQITGPSALCSGAATLSVTGNFTQYAWSNSQSGSTINVTQQGTYSVTVTDANGCTGTDSQVISGNVTNPAPAITGPTTLCSGSATLSVAGNFTQYAWSNSQSSATINVNQQGTYTITVTDANGCTGTDSQVISGNVSNPVPAITGPTTLCSGSATLSVAGNFTQYAWSNNQSSAAINVTQQGTYTVTVTDANGCTGTDSQVISGNVTNPAPAITGPTALCSGSATLSVAGNFTQYAWSNSQSNATINVNQQGTYTVTVTDANGCTGTDSQVINGSVTNPVPAITGPTALCSGAATLSVAGNFTQYAWSNNQSSAAINVTQQGTYTVTVTDANGCTGTDSQVINGSVTNPVPAITGPAALCASGVLLQLTGAYNQYNWSTGATTPEISVAQGGTYTVTVTDANGCTGTDTQVVSNNGVVLNPVITGPTALCSGTATLQVIGNFDQYNWSNSQNGSAITVTQQGAYTVTVTDSNGCTATDTQTLNSNVPNPVPSFTNPTVLCGSSLTLQVAGSYTQYLWSGGQTSPTLLISQPGNYNLTVTDANGCIGSAAISISGNALTVSTSATPATSCTTPNGAVTLTVNGAAGTAAFNWSNGSSTQNIQNILPGAYTVTVTDANGCTASSQSTVNGPMPMQLNISITAATSCTTANGALNLSVQSGTPPYAYLWSNSTTSEDLNQVAEGTYTVTVTDAGQCTASQTAVISNTNTSGVSSNQVQVICPGDSLLFNGIYYKNPGVYQQALTSWLGCDSVATLTLSWQNPGNYLAEADSFFVFNTLDAEILDVLFNDVLSNNQFTLEVLTQPQIGEVEVKDNEALLYRLGQEGFVGIEVIRYTLCSAVCTSQCDTAVALVIVTEDAEETLKKHLTNVLTPGVQDGLNDLFDPVAVLEELGHEVNELNSSLDIFNRWGDLIVSKVNTNLNWDGMSNNSPVPQGTYYFVFRADVGQSKPAVVAGAISVLRGKGE